jgi:hypothetical protein
METVTKIDITGNSIFCYDELANTQETYSLTSEYDFFRYSRLVNCKYL